MSRRIFARVSLESGLVHLAGDDMAARCGAGHAVEYLGEYDTADDSTGLDPLLDGHYVSSSLCKRCFSRHVRAELDRIQDERAASAAGEVIVLRGRTAAPLTARQVEARAEEWRAAEAAADRRREHLLEAVREAYASGASEYRLAQAAGVQRSTIRAWLGKDGAR